MVPDVRDRPDRVARALVTAVITAATLSSCGGSTSTTSTGQHSASSAPTDSASPTAPTAPTQSPTPTEAPGQLISLPHGTLTVPDGWTITPRDAKQSSFRDPHGALLGNVIDDNGGYAPTDNDTKKIIDEAAHESIETGDAKNMHRLPDLTVNGSRVFHVRGASGAPGHYWDEFGTIKHGHFVTVDFSGDNVFRKRSWQLEQMNLIIGTLQVH